MQLLRSKPFQEWIDSLCDRTGRAAILNRLYRLQNDNPGDAKNVGSGIYELRINFGPGYRVYYTRRGTSLIILLCGGDKSTQDSDIRRAKRLAGQIKLED